MFKNTIFRRMTALVLTLALAAAAALPGLAVYPMPIQTASETEAVYLFNADTGKTILNQNADQQQYVASLTKLMTALLLLESGKDLNGEVTVSTALTQEFRDIQNANGTTMGLRIGETVRRIDLLNAMLIVSANDAASVIAYDVGGSVLDFVKQMNARAQELGCTGTNFTCAHGLFDYGNVSTAQDLAKIAAACAANQTFAQVAGTASYVLPATNLRKAEHTISSSNSLMNSESANYREYVRWVKGGFTTLAGRCIVAFAEKDGHTYGLVILGCDTPDHLFAECDDLFDWAFASFADRPLVDTQTEITTVALTKCRTEPAVELYAAAPVSGYGHADDIVTYSFDLPESVSATVKSGSVIGYGHCLSGWLRGGHGRPCDPQGVCLRFPHRHEGDSASAVCTAVHPRCINGGHSCRGRQLAEPQKEKAQKIKCRGRRCGRLEQQKGIRKAALSALQQALSAASFALIG